jgi:hypothetical protein
MFPALRRTARSAIKRLRRRKRRRKEIPPFLQTYHSIFPLLLAGTALSLHFIIPSVRDLVSLNQPRFTPIRRSMISPATKPALLCPKDWQLYLS